MNDVESLIRPAYSSSMLPPLPETWRAALTPGPIPELERFLQQRQAEGRLIYPQPADRFAALERTPLPAVKAVILGQDPYHGPGQAHGLAFSVPAPQRKPPSLRNILRELADDLGIAAPAHGNLTRWATQGVLLLNAVLTVEAGQPGSHAGQGWEPLTREIIRAVSNRPGHAAFILWGAQAQKLASEINPARHLILRSAHPSPLSARHGFFGSRPFSHTNTFLVAHDIAPIDWRLD
jgi:uracil-DNA glycosylase